MGVKSNRLIIFYIILSQMALQENSLDVTRRDRKMISSLDQIDKMLRDMFVIFVTINDHVRHYRQKN